MHHQIPNKAKEKDPHPFFMGVPIQIKRTGFNCYDDPSNEKNTAEPIQIDEWKPGMCKIHFICSLY